MRFCISAAHTREMLDEALAVINDVGTVCMAKFSSSDHEGREAARKRLALMEAEEAFNAKNATVSAH